MKVLNIKGFNEEICDIDCNKLVFKPRKPVVIDFYSESCLPCRQMMPILEELSIKYSDVYDFYKINIDDGYEIADFFNMVGLPTIMLIKGQKKIQLAGVRTKEKLENFMLKFFNGNGNDE